MQRPVPLAVARLDPRRALCDPAQDRLGAPRSSPQGIRSTHHVARRIGALFGQIPPTQTGTRGRCTGVGVMPDVPG